MYELELQRGICLIHDVLGMRRHPDSRPPPRHCRGDLHRFPVPVTQPAGADPGNVLYVGPLTTVTGDSLSGLAQIIRPQSLPRPNRQRAYVKMRQPNPELAAAIGNRPGTVRVCRECHCRGDSTCRTCDGLPVLIFTQVPTCRTVSGPGGRSAGEGMRSPNCVSRLGHSSIRGSPATIAR